MATFRKKAKFSGCPNSLAVGIGSDPSRIIRMEELHYATQEATIYSIRGPVYPRKDEKKNRLKGSISITILHQIYKLSHNSQPMQLDFKTTKERNLHSESYLCVIELWKSSISHKYFTLRSTITCLQEG